MRQYAGERGDGEIGGGETIGNGLDDARRHEGEWNEPPDVSFDLVLASGDLLEGGNPTLTRTGRALESLGSGAMD
jgi:hypothetical protein